MLGPKHSSGSHDGQWKPAWFSDVHLLGLCDYARNGSSMLKSSWNDGTLYGNSSTLHGLQNVQNTNTLCKSWTFQHATCFEPPRTVRRSRSHRDDSCPNWGQHFLIVHLRQRKTSGIHKNHETFGSVRKWALPYTSKGNMNDGPSDLGAIRSIRGYPVVKQALDDLEISGARRKLWIGWLACISCAGLFISLSIGVLFWNMMNHSDEYWWIMMVTDGSLWMMMDHYG